MVLDSNAVRQRCECFQTYVDADVVAIVRQLRWLVLDRETCIPASCFTANRQGLDFALEVSMLFDFDVRSEEHTSELQSHSDLVCRLLLEKKNIKKQLSRQ